MLKYLALTSFLFIFWYLIRRSLIYVVPFTLLIFSNINGVLDWEDFAFRGYIKFQDYGLILTVISLLLLTGKPGGSRLVEKKSLLFRVILLFWLFYAFEFVYSVMLHGGVEWPLKMARTFFYGVSVFLILRLLKSHPHVRFRQIVDVLQWATLFFAVLYIGYNLFGWEVYAKDAYEEFELDGFEVVRRNFAGFPTFSFYFFILFLHRALLGQQRLLNLFGAALMALCVVFTLTRGSLILLALCALLIIVLRKPNARQIQALLLGAGVALASLVVLGDLGGAQLAVLGQRLAEFDTSDGIYGVSNFAVRAVEFSSILSGVLDFNALLGFGFTNIAELGVAYQSRFIHGGSADNGYSNLLGVTGLLGLTIYLLVLGGWLLTNLKLQLARDEFAKVHFVFIVYIVVSLFGGAAMSYMHNFALFIAYDIAALAVISRRTNSERVAPRHASSSVGLLNS